MVQYLYKAHAVDDNQVLTSTCFADDEGSVRSALTQMGYSIDSVKLHETHRMFGQRKRITLHDLVNMCRRFSIMYSAGLPLMDCLSSLARENESMKLSETLEDIRSGIERGSNVADAFSKHPGVFPSIFVNLLRAGESAGKFDYVLEQLATYMEKEYDLRRKVRQAFAYPIIVVIMLFLVVGAITIVVVPTFSEVYMQLGVVLPAPTRFLIIISDNAAYISPSTVVLVLGLWAMQRKLRTRLPVKRLIDRWKLSMPMVGPVYGQVVLLKFIRTLCTMITAGMQLSDALHIAEDVADNAVVSEATNMIQHNIKRGGTITEAIKLHSFFPQTIVHAFSTGEEAGKLGETLGRFAKGIEDDVDTGIKGLITKIEPLLVAILSFVVGFILLAIYLPIFDLMKLLHK